MLNYSKLIATGVFALASTNTYAYAYSQEYIVEGVFTGTSEGSLDRRSYYYGDVVSGQRSYASDSFQLTSGDASIFSSAILRSNISYMPDQNSDGEYIVGGNYYGAGTLSLDFGNNNIFSTQYAIRWNPQGWSHTFPTFFVDSNGFIGSGIFAGATHSIYAGSASTIYSEDSVNLLNLGSYSGTSTTYLRLVFTTAIPEPENYALLLTGLGLIGFVRKFKK